MKDPKAIEDVKKGMKQRLDKMKESRNYVLDAWSQTDMSQMRYKITNLCAMQYGSVYRFDDQFWMPPLSDGSRHLVGYGPW